MPIAVPKPIWEALHSSKGPILRGAAGLTRSGERSGPFEIEAIGDGRGVTTDQPLPCTTQAVLQERRHKISVVISVSRSVLVNQLEYETSHFSAVSFCHSPGTPR